MGLFKTAASYGILRRFLDRRRARRAYGRRNWNARRNRGLLRRLLG